MSSTFGDQPGDVVTSSRGDVLNGVSLSLYPTSADAVARTNLLATVVTNLLGRWSYTHATLTVVWVRTLDGQVYAVEDPTAAGAAEVAAAAADATSKVAAEAVLARIADNLTSGTVADARLPVTAQAATLSSTYGTLANRPLSLRGQPGIDFTGVTDSSVAVQAFINAAPDGSQIDLGRGGVLRLDSGLDLSAKANITLTGPTRSIAVSVGAPTQTELSFINMTTGIGLSLGVSATVRNLLVRGPGYGVAGVTGISSSAGIATLEGVQLLTWATGLALHTTWYGIIRDCEFRQNALAILVDHCYNLTIDIPKINGTNGAGFGVGISLTNTSMVNINNGSIEMCSPGVNMTTACSLNMDGTYWETSAANGVGVNMNGVSNAFVSARNCQVFINNYLGWIDYQNTSGGSTLNAEGNFFTTAGTGGTPTIPIAYMLDAVPGSEVSLGVGGPDNWRLVAVSFPTALYTNRDGLLAARLNMRAPAQYGGGIDGTSAKQGRHVRMALGMVVQLTATSTAGRTAAATAGNGGMAYDATLHKPIWSDGATWRDATGTAV